jgi:hypothetical protein
MGLLIPTNFYLGRRNATLQKKLLAFRDTRMRFLNEVSIIFSLVTLLTKRRY